MSMGDDSPLDRTPRVYVEATRRAVKAFRALDDKIFSDGHLLIIGNFWLRSGALLE